MTLHEITVTCPGGLEALVEAECVAMGASRVAPGRGAVLAQASLEVCYRLCLGSRFANHVLMRIATIPPGDADSLYHRLLGVAWEEWIRPAQGLFIAVSGKTPAILNTQHAIFRAKDAVVDRFRDRGLDRPVIDRERPEIILQLHLGEEGSVIHLNLNGASLHERGYRVASVEAPVKENLAAALVAWAGISPGMDQLPTMILDPLCGGGTLLIEAAWMIQGIAPGLSRRDWGFESWCGHDKEIWHRVRKEAIEILDSSRSRKWPSITGFDADAAAVRSARANIDAAGLSGRIHVERRSLSALGEGTPSQGPGVVLANPPYGDRLSQLDAAPYLYRCLGRRLRRTAPGWRAAILGAKVEHLDEFRVGQYIQHRCHNGPISCFVRVFDVPLSSEPTWPSFRMRTDVVVPAEGEHLANRIRKNWKQLSTWVQQESIRAFRLYDADLPEFNVAVDIYGDRVHVQEYAAPNSVDPAKSTRRLSIALDTISVLLGRRREEFALKTRSRQKGAKQYARQDDRSELYEIEEHGARLLVNLTDYLDTGIFLDHRPLRARLQSLCRDRHFLNLFCYTGTATVHAAIGGARSSVSVDLNPRYLAWAEANLVLNGFSTAQHRLVSSDVGSWLGSGGEQFEVIFMDAPTFSNSKRTENVLDIQRDHSGLVRSAMRHLSRGGVLLFSNNYRRFCLDEALVADFDVIDITKQTIPPDFTRNPKIHQCWEIRHRA